VDIECHDQQRDALRQFGLRIIRPIAW